MSSLPSPYRGCLFDSVCFLSESARVAETVASKFFIKHYKEEALENPENDDLGMGYITSLRLTFETSKIMVSDDV